MPFGTGRSIRITALELADVGLPLSLSGQCSKEGHILFKVEVILDIHNHKETSTFAVYLHIEDANLALASDDFRPYVGMSVHVLGNHLLVINERERLAVAFHTVIRLLSLSKQSKGRSSKLLLSSSKLLLSSSKYLIPVISQTPL